MKQQKTFWIYLCVAFLAGIVAVLLVLPLPREGAPTHSIRHQRGAPAYHHIEHAPDDLLHRFFSAF